MYCLLIIYKYSDKNTNNYKTIFKETEEECMKAFEDELHNLLNYTFYDEINRYYRYVKESDITYTIHEVPNPLEI